MRPLANATVESLEGEVNSGTHHPEIIVGSIDEIPTEVANPTNVRSKANFQAADDSAKARAAASENVGRETRARDRVTQGQRSQHRPRLPGSRFGRCAQNALTKIDKDIFESLSFINRPAFNPDSKVAQEKMFNVPATSPGMVGFQVAIIFPIVACEHVSAPKAYIKLIIRVPLRAGRRCRDLFHFFSRKTILFLPFLSRARGDLCERVP